MAHRGGHWIVTDPATGKYGRRFMTGKELAAAGFEKEFDALSFQQIVRGMPGKTPEERLKNALDDVLGNYLHSYDDALRTLRDAGPSGLIAFTGQGQMVGPRALAGAMRAARQNPHLHPLETNDEFYGGMRASQTAAARVRNRRPKEVIAREKRELEQRRDEAERLYGTRDLRKLPTAHKAREEQKRQASAARKASYRQAVKHAKDALKAAEKAAKKAAKQGGR